ncbi:MAG TPA: twin transmembrane helix small protein [Methylomirabilota bacterium]|nr:twin transmembrane helix small protein [Methylomirabilota bacterium]
MSHAVFVVLIVFLLATVGILFLGLFSMARGGEFNRKYGNKLMRFRVAFQAIAVLLVLTLILLKINS